MNELVNIHIKELREIRHFLILFLSNTYFVVLFTYTKISVHYHIYFRTFGREQRTETINKDVSSVSFFFVSIPAFFQTLPNHI